MKKDKKKAVTSPGCVADSQGRPGGGCGGPAEASSGESSTKVVDELHQQKQSLENVKTTFDSELQCSVCNELFVQATSLNCGHTFCSFCIVQWMRNSSACPMCRTKIASTTKNIALDNFITKMCGHLGDDVNKNRQTIVEERKAEQAKFEAAGSSTNSGYAPFQAHNGLHVMLHSDTDELPGSHGAALSAVTTALFSSFLDQSPLWASSPSYDTDFINNDSISDHSWSSGNSLNRSYSPLRSADRRRPRRRACRNWTTDDDDESLSPARMTGRRRSERSRSSEDNDDESSNDDSEGQRDRSPQRRCKRNVGLASLRRRKSSNDDVDDDDDTDETEDIGDTDDSDYDTNDNDDDDYFEHRKKPGRRAICKENRTTTESDDDEDYNDSNVSMPCRRDAGKRTKGVRKLSSESDSEEETVAGFRSERKRIGRRRLSSYSDDEEEEEEEEVVSYRKKSKPSRKKKNEEEEVSYRKKSRPSRKKNNEEEVSYRKKSRPSRKKNNNNDVGDRKRSKTRDGRKTKRNGKRCMENTDDAKSITKRRKRQRDQSEEDSENNCDVSADEVDSDEDERRSKKRCKKTQKSRTRSRKSDKTKVKNSKRNTKGKKNCDTFESESSDEIDSDEDECSSKKRSKKTQKSRTSSRKSDKTKVKNSKRNTKGKKMCDSSESESSDENSFGSSQSSTDFSDHLSSNWRSSGNLRRDRSVRGGPGGCNASTTSPSTSKHFRHTRPYYGGYGVCFKCGKPGHWINGCPKR